MLCGCPRSQLCETCFAGAWDNLRGVAACRGEVWAMAVAKQRARTVAWPAFEGRCADLARAKVTDLSDDPRLRERLASELARWARRWWAA